MTHTAGSVPCVTAALLPGLAAAHAPAAQADSPLWSHWDAAPAVVLPLLVASLLYLLGIVRLWHRAGVGRGIPRWRAASYFGGTLVLVVALMSPLDAASVRLFWAHMIQHLLLIIVAPPLIVAGAAELAFVWALPPGWRRGFGRFTRRIGGWLTGASGAGGNGMIVVALATGVLWLWHIPDLYDLAVRNEALHFAEHLSFVVTALLFWVTVLRLRPRAHAANGLRILSVFAMAVQGSMLGALITFAARPLYTSYAHVASAGGRGIDPLTDQQLAGLIMWIPPGLLYAGVAAWLLVRWLKAIGARRDEFDRRRDLSGGRYFRGQH